MIRFSSSAQRVLSLAAALSAIVIPAAQAVPSGAQAEPGLAVGSCVVADKRHPGRITQVLPYGYVVKGFGANDSPLMWPTSDVVAAACPASANAKPPAADRGGAPATGDETGTTGAAAGGAMCFANDRVAGSSVDQRARAAIVRGFSHEPQPGEDGRITVHIRTFALGASRGASPMDQVQYQTVAGRTIYDVRTTFQTCTDYNRRLVYVTRERNFVCFTKASGVFDCTMTANTPNLAHDVTREVPKAGR